MSEIKSVLDASALLAFLQKEKGAELVEETIVSRTTAMSTVNLCEVYSKLFVNKMDMDRFEHLFSQLRIRIIMLDHTTAKFAGKLRAKTMQYGLSLGDRVCLALAKQLSAKAITTDSLWMKLNPEYNVVLIR